MMASEKPQGYHDRDINRGHMRQVLLDDIRLARDRSVNATSIGARVLPSSRGCANDLISPCIFRCVKSKRPSRSFEGTDGVLYHN